MTIRLTRLTDLNPLNTSVHIASVWVVKHITDVTWQYHHLLLHSGLLELLAPRPLRASSRPQDWCPAADTHTNQASSVSLTQTSSWDWSGLSFTPGASSMIFWGLCTLQSLSNRYTASPNWSPNTCTSTCLVQQQTLTITSQDIMCESWAWSTSQTLGSPQTSRSAWRRRWMTCGPLCEPTPAAPEALLLSAWSAFGC